MESILPSRIHRKSKDKRKQSQNLRKKLNARHKFDKIIQRFAIKSTIYSAKSYCALTKSWAEQTSSSHSQCTYQPVENDPLRIQLQPFRLLRTLFKIVQDPTVHLYILFEKTHMSQSYRTRPALLKNKPLRIGRQRCFVYRESLHE